MIFVFSYFQAHYACLYLSILSPARRPGPGLARARPAHEPCWAAVGRDLEAREFFFWPEPVPKCCF
jgi:hypothetical protein